MVRRNADVSRVLTAVLGLNLLVAAIKLTLGFLTGSLAILADAFHSLIDSSSNVVGLLGVWIAGRPADDNHPYGHQRFETIAALGIGVMLALAAYEIGTGVFQRLTAGVEIPVTGVNEIALMAGTFAINVVIVWYESREGRRLNSPVLLADAQHTRTDLFVTVSVVAALIGGRLGWAWLDPVVALGVVVLLAKAAWGIVSSASLTLTDAAVLDPKEVERIACAVPGVTAVHGVRSRNRGDGAWIDLAIAVDPVMDTPGHGHGSGTRRGVRGRATDGRRLARRGGDLCARRARRAAAARLEPSLGAIAHPGRWHGPGSA